MKIILHMAKVCRVEHWIKNFLILFPAFFVTQIFGFDLFRQIVPALLSFSFVASAVYVVNDIMDVERDRQHPVKRNRPIASGELSVSIAWVMFVVLVVSGFVLAKNASSVLLAETTLACYLIANLGYSLWFKNIALVDVFILSSGFVFRIFFGGFYFSIPISSWLFLCVLSAALFFAFGKRKSEFRRYGADSQTRSVLASYDETFLAAHYYISCALMILFYCLWTISRTDQRSVGKLALTIPVMMFIVFRYNLLVEKNDVDADPVPLFLHDRWLMLGASLFLATNFVVLYFGGMLPRVQY